MSAIKLRALAHYSAITEEAEMEYCGQCAGSGEGMHDGASCSACGGVGEVFADCELEACDWGDE